MAAPAHDELLAWLRLLRTPGLAPAAARKLLAAFGSPQAIWHSGHEARAAVVGHSTAALLNAPSSEAQDACARSLAWLDEAANHHIITLGDAAYPAALLQTADPPLLLWARGDLQCLERPALAMVGSRNATAQGLATATDFARHFSRMGITVVSGLALGIDAAAHQGALDGAGRTIAVIGTGCDVDYPRRNAALIARIANEGLILSEYVLGEPPLAANFPRRNRIIAGLAHGTLVVEAAVQSGSLITARLASECGREVYAIPGSIHAPQARGCHALIKGGAKLVESAQDVMDEWPGLAQSLQAPRQAAASTAAAPQAQALQDTAAEASPLLQALGHSPTSLDALVARTGWPAEQLHAQLLELELDGHVARLPGGLFQRIARV